MEQGSQFLSGQCTKHLMVKGVCQFCYQECAHSWIHRRKNRYRCRYCQMARRNACQHYNLDIYVHVLGVDIPELREQCLDCGKLMKILS